MMNIEEIVKNLKILYVEDEEQVRALVSKRLTRLSDFVVAKEDGAKALDLFRSGDFDMVISDISMPNMDGITMIKEIKKIDSEIPIALTTAHSDEDHFLASIEAGVDKYIIKPIDFEALKDTIYAFAKRIEDRKKAQEYERRALEERINSVASTTIDVILDSSPNPTILEQDGVLKFVNRAFVSLFDGAKLEEVSKDFKKFDELLFKKEGYLSSLEELNLKNPSENIISIRVEKGRKVYRVYPKKIEIHQNSATIYTLNDITLSEYQKIKIKNYSTMLEGYIFESKYKQSQSTPKDVESKIETKSIVCEVGDKECEEKKEKFSLDNDSLSVLRRSHKHKTTALEYVEEIDEETLAQIQELEELEREIIDLATIMKEDLDNTNLYDIAQKFQAVGNLLNALIEFRDLAYALTSLSDFINSVDKETLDDIKLKKIARFSILIAEEIKSWRETIFVNQNTIDIHYLDASLFSSCLQIELELKNKSASIEQESDDDELVFF